MMALFYDLAASALVFLSVVALFFDKSTAVVLAILSVTVALLYLGEPCVIKFPDEESDDD